jgi:hypothetical protein
LAIKDAIIAGLVVAALRVARTTFGCRHKDYALDARIEQPFDGLLQKRPVPPRSACIEEVRGSGAFET